MKFDVENFFQDYGINHITEGSKHCQTGWVQTECPFCTGNPGHHLGYSLISDYFNCWRCGFHSTYEVVRVLASQNWDDAKKIYKQYLTASSRNHLMEGRMVAKAERVKLPPKDQALEERYTRYLEVRGFDPARTMEEWDLFGTGMFGDYKYRIIAPITYNGSLVSYQGRDFTDKSGLKYKACPQDQEVIDHKKLLYGLDKVPGDTVVLVEGITDVWRLGPGAVASFGIKTKPSQIFMLAERFHKVFIMFDDDPQAIKSAEAIGFNLAMCGVESEICLIDGDPGGLKQRTADRYMKILLGE